MTYKPLDISKSLRYLSHPVAVITVNDGKQLNGMTAAWITQISIEPPILCTAISPKRHTWDMLKDIDYFGVCQLADFQKDISNIFGSLCGRSANKFEQLDIVPFMGAHNVPLIPNTIAAFVCRKTHQVEQGDHWAVFGEVVEAWKGPEARPLNWHRSRYLE